MFIGDLKREFYDVILGQVHLNYLYLKYFWAIIYSRAVPFVSQRVLIFVNFDVDAICSCRILQYLLLCDTVSYSILPVRSLGELVAAYKESCEQVPIPTQQFKNLLIYLSFYRPTTSSW